ncbi:response regulator [Kitasatospora sp. NPDC058397]|uniref:response regulator n=2 Tax=unclassified Kitasatospora TaxID=2633591 RepID=UPI003653B992
MISTMESPIRILVADDHTLLREVLCEVLSAQSDFDVIAQAGDGSDAVALSARIKPDIALLDIEMPGSKPLLTVRRLREASPRTQVIILSMYADPRLIQELLELGIRGYLHKTISQHDLAAAIRGVWQDRDRVILSVTRNSIQLAPAVGDAELLSTREQEVLGLVAGAMSNRQIAARLSIAEGTVKLHLRNVFRKLDAVSRIDAVNKAVEASLISRPEPVRAPRHIQHSRPIRPR